MIRYPRLLNPTTRGKHTEMYVFDLYWSPTGQKIATVEAKSAKSAISKAPSPYRKYKGEIYAVISKVVHPYGNRGRKHNCDPDGIEHDKWIPAHAVRFNKDGSVSMMR
jgi:hypothetical protein